MSPQRLGITAALLTCISWGAMFPIMAHVLAVFDPFWLTSIRYVGASLVLVAILFVVEGRDAFRLEGRLWSLTGLGGASIAGFNILVLEGIRITGAEHGSLIVAMSPLITAVMLWLRYGTKPARITVAMIALAFAGVALVVTKGDVTSVLRHGSGLGDLMILLGVIGFMIYGIGAAAFADWSRLRFTTITVTLGTVVTLVLTALASAVGLAHLPSTALDGGSIGGMVYLVFVAAVFAYIAWNFAIAKIGPQNTVLFMNAVPIVTFAIELLLGHRFLPVEYAGAAVTIAALVFNNVATRPRAVANAVGGGARASTSSA